METTLRKLKTINAIEFINTILKRSQKVLLDTFNLAALTWPVFMSKSIEF